MKQISWMGTAMSPSKFVCVGRNYVAHIQELNNVLPSEPVIFTKPNSALAERLYAGLDEPIHFEAELCFLVNKGRLTAVGFGLDLTKRALQGRLKQQGLPWERAKAFDDSAVFSEFVAFDDVSSLRIELQINGQVVQFGGVDLMIYSPHFLLEEISDFMTLLDGDVVMTGTPKGVGPLVLGDDFTGSVFEADKLLVSASWTVESKPA